MAETPIAGQWKMVQKRQNYFAGARHVCSFEIHCTVLSHVMVVCVGD